MNNRVLALCQHSLYAQSVSAEELKASVASCLEQLGTFHHLRAVYFGVVLLTCKCDHPVTDGFVEAVFTGRKAPSSIVTRPPELANLQDNTVSRTAVGVTLPAGVVTTGAVAESSKISNAAGQHACHAVPAVASVPAPTSSRNLWTTRASSFSAGGSSNTPAGAPALLSDTTCQPNVGPTRESCLSATAPSLAVASCGTPRRVFSFGRDRASSSFHTSGDATAPSATCETPDRRALEGPVNTFASPSGASSAWMRLIARKASPALQASRTSPPTVAVSPSASVSAPGVLCSHPMAATAPLVTPMENVSSKATTVTAVTALQSVVTCSVADTIPAPITAAALSDGDRKVDMTLTEKFYGAMNVRLEVTLLGHAAFASGLGPDEAVLVLQQLTQARRGLVLTSPLHLCYYVVPSTNILEPDWSKLCEVSLDLT